MNNEKNIYVEARKQSNLTQAKASEAMQTISEDRLARLETREFRSCKKYRI